MKFAFKTFALYAPFEVEWAFKDFSEAGYQGIELSAQEAADADQVRALCAKHRIEISAISAPSFKGDDIAPLVKVVDLCRKLKVNNLLLLPPAKAAISWKDLINQAVQLGEMSSDLILTLHHHAGTMVETLDETERFLRDVDMENVGLCFDTAHAYMFGDLDKWIKNLGSSIKYVHVKDLDKPREELNIERDKLILGSEYYLGIARMFTDLGEGVINFREVFEALRRIGYDGWLSVEIEIQRWKRLKHLASNLNFMRIYL